MVAERNGARFWWTTYTFVLVVLCTASLTLVSIAVSRAATMEFKDGVPFLIGGLSTTLFVVGSLRPLVAGIGYQRRLYVRIDVLIKRLDCDASGEIADAYRKENPDERKKALARKEYDYWRELSKLYEEEIRVAT